MPAEFAAMRQLPEIDPSTGQYHVPDDQYEHWDHLRKLFGDKIRPLWKSDLFMPVKEFFSVSWPAPESTCLWIDESREPGWEEDPDFPDSWGIAMFWTPDMIEAIRKAIREERPYLWPNYEYLLSRPLGSTYSTRRLYLFGNHLWERSRKEWSLSNDDFFLVIQDAVNKERRKMARLRKSVKAGQVVSEFTSREAIEEDVRIFVWRRDNGRCVRCGSQERLEFDHIIPVSKGGSSTARNIQILCERCNREKGDSI
jgi:hypothetical protein